MMACDNCRGPLPGDPFREVSSNCKDRHRLAFLPSFVVPLDHIIFPRILANGALTNGPGVLPNLPLCSSCTITRKTHESGVRQGRGKGREEGEGGGGDRNREDFGRTSTMGKYLSGEKKHSHSTRTRTRLMPVDRPADKTTSNLSEYRSKMVGWVAQQNSSGR